MESFVRNDMQERLILAFPKGRLYKQLAELMKGIGFELPDVESTRQYHYKDFFAEGVDLFVAKPKAIPQLLESGLCQYGFCGQDIMLESLVPKNTVEELANTHLNSIRIVLAAKKGGEFIPKKRPVICASEFPNIASRYFTDKGLSHYILDTGGSTEGYPFIGADCIVDVCETGVTLEKNGLEIKEVLAESSTAFFGRTDHKGCHLIDEIKNEITN